MGQVVLQRRQGEPQEAPLQQAQRALLVELRKLAQPVRQPAAGGTFQLMGCLGKTGREAGGACEAVGGARAAPRPAALASPPVQVVHLCRVDVQEFVALQAPQGGLQLLIEAVVARLRALAAIQCWLISTSNRPAPPAPTYLHAQQLVEQLGHQPLPGHGLDVSQVAQPLVEHGALIGYCRGSNQAGNQLH